MISPDNLNRRSIFKHKQLAFSPSTKLLQSHPSPPHATSARNKNSLTQSALPQLMQTITVLSPGNTVPRPMMSQLINNQPQVTSTPSLPARRVMKSGNGNRRRNVKPAEILVTENSLLEESSDMIQESTARDDSKIGRTPSPLRSTKERDSIDISKDRATPKSNMLSSLLKDNASDLIVSSNGRVLRKLPIKDRWLDNLPSDNRSKSPTNGEKLRTSMMLFYGGTTKRHLDRKVGERSDRLDSDKYTLFNQTITPKSVLYSDDRDKTDNLTFLKVKRDVVANWGETTKNFSLEQKAEKIGSPKKGSDNDRVSHDLKLKVETGLKSRLNKGERKLKESSMAVSQKLLNQKIINSDNLSYLTEYTYLDRHDVIMAKRNHLRRQNRLKPRGSKEEDIGYLSMKLSYSQVSNAVHMGKSVVDERYIPEQQMKSLIKK